jgi:hypothetical protein
MNLCEVAGASSITTMIVVGQIMMELILVMLLFEIRIYQRVMIVLQLCHMVHHRCLTSQLKIWIYRVHQLVLKSARLKSSRTGFIKTQ